MAKKKVTQIKRTAPQEITAAIAVRAERTDTIEARIEIPPWPPGLPTDAAKFWTAGADLAALAELPKLDDTPALKRLGPLPFPRSGFPLMGFLATLYEHVVNHLGRPDRPLDEIE